MVQVTCLYPWLSVMLYQNKTKRHWLLQCLISLVSCISCTDKLFFSTYIVTLPPLLPDNLCYLTEQVVNGSAALFRHLYCHAPFCVRFISVSANGYCRHQDKESIVLLHLLHCLGPGLSYSYICKILASFTHPQIYSAQVWLILFDVFSKNTVC